MYWSNLKSVALHVPEIRPNSRYPIWTVPGYAHAPFSPKFLKGFCLDEPIVLAKFEFRSLYPFLRYYRLEFWMGVSNSNLGEEEAVGGREWYRWKKRW